MKTFKRLTMSVRFSVVLVALFLVVLFFGCGGGEGDPSVLVSWTEMPQTPFVSPNQKWETVRKIGFLGNQVLVLKDYYSGNLFRSQDGGQTWQWLNTGLNPHTIWGNNSHQNVIFDMDVDGQNLYLGTGSGLAVSSDGGQHFHLSFSWSWDEFCTVDFEGGYGYGEVANFGSKSGAWFKTPTSGWGKWSAVTPIVFDAVDPKHYFYAGRTRYERDDQGKVTSFGTTSRALLAKNISGQSVVFADSDYSLDHGITWLPLGLVLKTADSLAVSPAGNLLFAVDYGSSSCWVGQLGGQWRPLTMNDVKVDLLAVGLGKLWAVSDNQIFTADLVQIESEFYKP